MRFMSGNPAIKNLTKEVNANGNTVKGEVYSSGNISANDVASYKGVGFKALYFAILVLVVAVLSATFLPVVFAQNISTGYFILGGAFVGIIIFGIISSFSRNVALWGTLYAICEAVLIGFISYVYEFGFNNIVLIALLTTVLAFVTISACYAFGLIKVTNRFRGVVLSALIALIVAQLMILVLSLFVPSLFDIYSTVGFWVQLGICSLSIVIACAMLAVDLNNITNLVENRMPKQYEWRAAFGLVVTLIWLYLEILRLLVMIFARRR